MNMIEVTFFERQADGAPVFPLAVVMPVVPRVNDFVTVTIKAALVRCRVVDVDWLPPADGDTATSVSVQIVQKYEPGMEDS